MLPISANVKVIAGTLLAGLIPAGTYLLKLEPGWTWLSVALGALVYVDGLLTVPAAAVKK
jgi:hypothetical protein